MTDHRDAFGGERRVDVHQAWHAQPAGSYRLSSDEPTRQRRRAELGVRNMAAQVYVAATFNVIMWTAFAIVFSETLARAGAILALIGWGFIILEMAIHRRRTLAMIAANVALPAAAFYRTVLIGEWNFTSDPALWRRFTAMIVGPLVFIYGSGRTDLHGTIVVAVVGGVWIALTVLGPVLGRRRARALRRQIDEVSRELSDGP